MSGFPSSLLAGAFAIAALAALTAAARGATAAGAGIEVDGRYVGGYTITRKAETRDELVRGLAQHRLTFERDYRVPVEADDPDRATLRGKIRLLSKIRGDRVVMGTTESLLLVQRKGAWFVEPTSLQRALRPAKEAEPEEGGTVGNPDRDRCEGYFKALSKVGSAAEEERLLTEFGQWLRKKNYRIQVEVRDGKHRLACPYFPPVTPWTDHAFLDVKHLELLPRLEPEE